MLRASILLLSVLLLAGCSDDEADQPDAEPTPDRAAVIEGLGALYAGDHAGARDVELGACFGEELVDRAGYDALVDAGVLDEDYGVVTDLPVFDQEMAGLWVDAQFTCVDFVDESTRALSAQTKGKLDKTAYARCLREALDERQIRDAVEATLMNDWLAPKVTALADAQSRCSADAQPPG